jgi:hypothetical protein
VVFQVPLLRRVERQLQADEEVLVVLLEVVHRLGRDARVEADEAFLVCI